MNMLKVLSYKMLKYIEIYVQPDRRHPRSRTLSKLQENLQKATSFISKVRALIFWRIIKLVL